MNNDVRCSMCEAANTMEIAAVSDLEVELQCRNCGYFFDVDITDTDWSKIAIQILSVLHDDLSKSEGNVFLFPVED